MPFDTRAAKLLQPGEYMLITDCPGLRLVASATRKTWTYRFQAVQTKQMKQVAIGHWPAMPVSAAMAQWHALREQRSDGVTPAPPRQVKKRPAVTKPDQTTVGQVVRDYVSGHLITSRGAASAIAAQRALDRVIDEIGDLPVAAISRAVAFDTLDCWRRRQTPPGRRFCVTRPGVREFVSGCGMELRDGGSVKRRHVGQNRVGAYRFG